MEQEQVLGQFGRASVVTFELVFKIMSYLVEYQRERRLDKLENKHFAGETTWNKLMATAGEKETQQLLTNEVNLDALKTELEKYGVAFSFYHHDDGTTTLLFDAKNKDIVRHAFEGMLGDMVKDSKGFEEKMAKDPKEQSFGEKMNAAKQREAQNIKEAKMTAHTKAFAKEPIKAEPYMGGMEK